MFLKLAGRSCVVVGGGALAETKVESLLHAGARVTVIAPEATQKLSQFHRRGVIRWYLRAFAAGDLAGAWMAIAATSDDQTNELVYRECERRGVLCNAVDQPQRCHFYFPAVVQRGDLQIAISTNGKSPSLAQRLRKDLEVQFGPEYQDWVRWLGEVRQSLMARKLSFAVRKRVLAFLAARESFERWRRARNSESSYEEAA
jgi:precorrin-2 dehydrogenase/sirohydrochlorin ferrochelatase